VTGLVTLLVIYPLALLPRINALRFTSVAAVVCVLYLVVVICVKSGMQIADDFDSSRIVYGTASLNMFQAFPIITFAFSFHMTLFNIQAAMQRPGRILMVVLMSMLSAGLLYIVVGMFGYLSFFEETNENVLLNYENDIAVTVGKFALALVMCFSFPLLHYPLRESILNLCFPPPTQPSCWQHCYCDVPCRDPHGHLAYGVPSRASLPEAFRHSEEDPHLRYAQDRNDDAYRNAIEDGFDVQTVTQAAADAGELALQQGVGTPARSWMLHIVVTTWTVTAIYLATVVIPNISAIFGLVGATVGTILIYLFPAAFLLRLVPGSVLRPLKLFAILLFFIGSVLGVVGTYVVLANW
jgi:amino acid permease